ncbi:hypothetical protein C0992_011988 [Termitomyces sp. T32_za158]|nr:hypothetical protein C0992_011988 [Termitomyces sp. T32_za158]
MAVHNTGPLQHPWAATGTGNASTKGAGQVLHFEPSTSTSPAVGSTDPKLEATKPEISRDSASGMDHKVDSSLTSSESDGDDYCDDTFVPPEVDTDNNQLGLGGQFQEEIFMEACRNLTDEQRALIDRRMENVQFISDNQSGEPSHFKVKIVDLRNWGDIEFDEVEIAL